MAAEEIKTYSLSYIDDAGGMDTMWQPVRNAPESTYANSSDSEDINRMNRKLLDEYSLDKVENFKEFTIDELKNLNNVRRDRKRSTTLPSFATNATANEAIKSEKKRIADQRQSKETNRSDMFGIGTVYLSVPPTSISISQENRNYRFQALRTQSEIVTSSGRSTIRIDLDIEFNGVDDINGKLRPLLAQFKCMPFLPIDNDHIRSVLNPSKPGDSPNTYNEKDAAKKLKALEEKSEGIKTLIANTEKNSQTIQQEIRHLVNVGALTPDSANKLQQALLFEVSGENEDTVRQDIPIEFWEGNGDSSIDFPGYLNYLIASDFSEGSTQTAVTMGLDTITGITRQMSKDYSNLGTMQEEQNQLFADYNDSYVDNAIVGVLSQFTVSTMPGFPEALSCRISMNVFNYDAYVSHFGYVKGYDKNNFTPLITECDLFIDWYSTRFLQPGQSDGLGLYSIDDSTTFRYAKEASYGNMANMQPLKFVIERIGTDSKTVVTGISASLRNSIQFLPLLSSESPTCQYLGAMNSSITINMNSVDIEKIKALKNMVDNLGAFARTLNRTHRYVFFTIDNPLVQMCGTKFLVPESIAIDTVPGNPGLYSMSIMATEVKIGSEKVESLNRFTLDSEEDLMNAAEFILDSAIEYMRDTDKTHRNTMHQGLYYNMLFSNGETLTSPLAKMVTRTLPNIPSVEPRQGETLLETTLRVDKKDSTRNDEYKVQYVKNLINAMNGGTVNTSRYTQFNLESEMEFLKKTLVMEANASLKQMLATGDVGYRDIQNYVYNNSKTMFGDSGKDGSGKIIDKTCYPDLELPSYADLGDAANNFKLTYGDVGLLAEYVGMRDDPAQLDSVAIEPDAFFYKGSIHKILNNSATSIADAGLESFRQVIRNSLSSFLSPSSASDTADSQIEALAADNARENEAIDAEKMQTAQDVASSMLMESGGLCRIVDVVSPGIYKVRPLGKASIATKFDIPMINDAASLAISAAEANAPSIMIKDASYTPTFTSSIPSATTGGSASSEEERSNVENTKRLFVNGGRIVKVNIVDSGGTMLEDTSAMGQIKGVGNSVVNLFDNIAKGKFMLSDKSKSDPATTEVTKQMLAIPGAMVYLTDDNRYQTVGDYLRQEGSVKMMNAMEDVLFDFGKKIAAEKTVKKRKFNKNLRISIGSNGEMVRVDQATEESEINSERYISGKIGRTFNLDPKSANSTFFKWDRYLEDHMAEITRRIKEHAKDDMLRMVKAFPTFKFYFIEEDRMGINPLPWPVPEWRNLDDLFSYDAILSIDINKSRKDAADTAVVRILNTRGTLDTERFGNNDAASNNQDRGLKKTYNPRDFDTVREHDSIENFVLKAGTRIRIKMGYSSDPSLLENVFTGIIAEITPGDVITIVAQGYGIELMKKITGWNAGKKRIASAAPYKVLDHLMARTEIMHFGYRMTNDIGGPRERILGMRKTASYDKWNGFGAENTFDYNRSVAAQSAVNKTSASYGNQSSYRNAVDGLFSFFNDPRNDNIFTPEQDVFYDEFTGERYDYLYDNKTLWDVCQDLSRGMPGYVAQVIPFDSRATLYFGPKDFYYCFSDEIAGLYNMTGAAISNGRSLIDNSISDGELTLLSYEEKVSLIEDLHGIINRTPYEDLRIRGGGSWMQNIPGRTVGTTEQVLENTLISANKTGSLSSREYGIIQKFRDMHGLNSIVSGEMFIDPQFTKEGDEINVLSSDPKKIESWIVYRTKDDLYYDEPMWLGEKRISLLAIPPYYRMFRYYHYKDSYKSIIANNIVATDQNMWNRVELTYGRRTDDDGNYRKESAVGNAGRVIAQVDDNIWREKLKPKIVVEPNAFTIDQRWNYAVGNLMLGVNEIYNGSLVLMGDPSIKPFDVILMDDYYTDMHGCIEVREVNHHFSQDTGFITTVVPDCIAYSRNKVCIGSDIIAGGWNDEVARALLGVYHWKIPFVRSIEMKHVLTVGGIIAAAWALDKSPQILGMVGRMKTAAKVASTADEAAAGISEVAARAEGMGEWIDSAISSTGKADLKSLKLMLSGLRPTFLNTGKSSLLGLAGSVAGVLALIAPVAAAIVGTKIITGTTAAIGRAAFANPVVAGLGVAAIGAEALIFPTLRRNFNSMKFMLTSLTTARREPIDILPLVYCGRAYIAGLQGMRRSQWWEPTMEGLRRFQFYYTVAAPRYIREAYKASFENSGYGISSASYK